MSGISSILQVRQLGLRESYMNNMAQIPQPMEIIWPEGHGLHMSSHFVFQLGYFPQMETLYQGDWPVHIHDRSLS